MPQTRASPDPDSPTDSKRRRSMDWPDWIEPNPAEANFSPIDTILNEYCIMLMATELENSDEFVGTAKKLLKFLEDMLPNSLENSCEELFSSMVGEVWKNSCFIDALRTTIAKEFFLSSLVIHYSNGNSNKERMAHMVADRALVPSLMSIKDASTTTTMRVFLSILFGYWADKEELAQLDSRTDKKFFGRMLLLSARATKSVASRGEPDFISYEIADASCSEDMEPLREKLVSKYGHGKIDIEAILKRVKTDLSNLLNICLNHLGYDAKRAMKIEIPLTDGYYYNTLSMTPI